MFYIQFFSYILFSISPITFLLIKSCKYIQDIKTNNQDEIPIMLKKIEIYIIC